MVLLTERGTDGLKLINASFENVTEFKAEDEHGVRSVQWSPDGKLLAYCNNKQSMIVRASDWSVITRLELPRTLFFKWSPGGDQLVTFHQYYETKNDPNPGPNVFFWSIPSGDKMGSFIHKGTNEGWEPHWTQDSNFIIRKIGEQLISYSRAEPSTVAYKEKVEKMLTAAVAPGKPPYKVAVFGKATSKQPAFIRVLKLPEMKEKMASKSFYKADSCVFKWSPTGADLLALTSTEVSQDSYYGENMLYLLNARKGDSQAVDLSKKGPIYSVEWSPNGSLFCAVYGFMPAKATLYDNKGNVKFDYGTGPRNMCFFNQHATLLMIAGFGNLRGKMECWDLEKHVKVSEPDAPDTTHFEWCPDGVHYVWATTAPRLRVGNGWKVSHYHGELKHERAYNRTDKTELWQVAYQPDARTKPVPIVKPTQQQQKQQESRKSTGYVPPHARGRADYKAKIREDEKPSNPNDKLESVINQQNNIKSGIRPEEPKMSAAALKNKKKREAKKAAAETTRGRDTPVAETTQSSEQQSKGQTGGGGTQLSESEKEIRKLNKKLDAIEKLKTRQASGQELEKNQLEKLKTENDILEQIKKLQLTQ